MKGYITTNASLQECFDFLKKENAESHPLYKDIQERYNEELKRWQQRDNEAYSHSHTETDCRNYIAQYCKLYYYTPLHQKDIADRLEDCIWAANKNTIAGCNAYICKYPHGKYIKDAKRQIHTGNATNVFLIVISVILCIAIIVLLMCI